MKPVSAQASNGIGIGLSAACILHCLGTPLLIAALPGLTWLAGEWVHISLAIAAAFILVLSMRQWPRSPLGTQIRILGIVSVAGLFLAALAGVSERAEQIMTIISAIGLSLAHLTANFQRWHGG
jgi:hypothetical protein